jgi:hypothetical protein
MWFWFKKNKEKNWTMQLPLSAIPNLKSYEKDYNLTENETLFHKHQRKIE